MENRLTKRFFAFPFYRGVLPLLRRVGFARPSAYDWAAYYLQRNRVRVSCIADVGAFDGAIASHLAALFPHATVYAFEPAPASFASLEKRARRERRIKPFCLALSDTSGTAVLNINRSPGTSSFLPTLDVPVLKAVMQGGNETLDRVECPTRTLDEFLAAHPDVQPQLLKSDTQGFELHVLQGARSALARSIRVVVAEVRFAQPAYHGDTSLLETLDEFLAAVGFRLYCIPALSAHRITRRAMEADAVWVRDSA